MISYGLRTLVTKEVRRFMRVPGQTLLSPLVTTTLYFVVFGFSLGGSLRTVNGVPYARFIVPGLVALGVVTNAYVNASSSFFIMKLQGTIVDLLVSPLSYGELLVGFVAAAVCRGFIVGAITWLVAGLFGGFELVHPFATIGLVLLAGTAFASLGLVTAIWAKTFEQVNFIPTFFITPLTFLGGVFYSVEMLPRSLKVFTLVNPVFYMVDGLRRGMIGVSDAPSFAGPLALGVLALLSTGTAFALLRSGWRLRG